MYPRLCCACECAGEQRSTNEGTLKRTNLASRMPKDGGTGGANKSLYYIEESNRIVHFFFVFFFFLLVLLMVAMVVAVTVAVELRFAPDEILCIFLGANENGNSRCEIRNIVYIFTSMLLTEIACQCKF